MTKQSWDEKLFNQLEYIFQETNTPISYIESRRIRIETGFIDAKTMRQIAECYDFAIQSLTGKRLVISIFPKGLAK